MELSTFLLMVFTNLIYEKYEVNSAFLMDVLEIMGNEPTSRLNDVPEIMQPKKSFMWDKRHNIVDVVCVTEHSPDRRTPPEYSYKELKTACSGLAAALSVDFQDTPTRREIDVMGNRYQAIKCDLIIRNGSEKITFNFYLVPGPVLDRVGQIWYLSIGKKYGEVDIFVYDVKRISGKDGEGKIVAVTIYRNTFNYYFSSIICEILQLIAKYQKERKYKLVGAAEAECYNGQFILKKNENIIRKNSKGWEKVRETVRNHEKVQTLGSQMRKGKKIVKDNTLGKIEAGLKKGNKLARSGSKIIIDTGNEFVRSGSQKIIDTGNVLVKSGSKKFNVTKEKVQHIASNSVKKGKEIVKETLREAKANLEKMQDGTSSKMEPIFAKVRRAREKRNPGEKRRNEEPVKNHNQSRNKYQDWEEYPLLDNNQASGKGNRKSEKVSNVEHGGSKDQKVGKDEKGAEEDKDWSKYARSSTREKNVSTK